MPEAVGLYVSIPFCKAKCTFCNFASEAFPPERMQGYVERLGREIAGAQRTASKVAGELPYLADSVYLGGGTPSLLAPEQLRWLLQSLRERFAVTAEAEITMEAAPGQIGDALLEEALRSGVNRVSLGVQSFVDREAKAVGRLHTGAACRAEIDRLREAGVPRLSVDLIAGLPHQTAESWAESLRAVTESGAEHVSVYMLETDGESRLGTEVERLRAVSQLAVLGQDARYSAAAVPSEERVVALYGQACEALSTAGFAQYEISNFARPGAVSTHNRKYWDRKPYFGFGLDAHSMLERLDGSAVRFRNAEDLNAYMNARAPADVTPVDALAAFEETVFLGLRRNEGVSLEDLSACAPPGVFRSVLERVRELAAEELLVCDRHHVRLTPKGRVLSSAVFGELLTVAA